MDTGDGNMEICMVTWQPNNLENAELCDRGLIGPFPQRIISTM